MMNKLRGSITLVQLVSWGVSLSIAVGGIMWAKIASTDGNVQQLGFEQGTIKERTAKIEEAISTIKADNAEIKTDIKTLLQRTR